MRVLRGGGGSRNESGCRDERGDESGSRNECESRGEIRGESESESGSGSALPWLEGHSDRGELSLQQRHSGEHVRAVTPYS